MQILKNADVVVGFIRMNISKEEEEHSVHIFERERKSELSTDKVTFGMLHFFPYAWHLKRDVGNIQQYFPKVCSVEYWHVTENKATVIK